ncbi:ABC transporter domain-containing protein [Plasmodiophora brassicae]|uniref:ABC transporter domain-containing protein n=1 Tax=Plasmodiophora brassicae TaxID=37360 RepID=A0A0G4IJR3_PLABS|nr:hypothetical protein PBRA_004135 [Plasmodiophora brassicae]SPR00286.1 unnamed protein product [Plasmodiophora brassicae]
MDVEQGPASGKNDADVAVELSWHDVRYEVPLKDGTSKVIIDNASGNAKPGELLVIMGGSGGGKSTMLDLIRGRAKPTSGTILVNGHPRTSQFKHIASYVQQEDALYPVLTVRETITYAARLQLASTPRAALEEKVAQLIKTMGLVRCADTRIGNALLRGVSGGERRRVSICVELVTDPQVILLDEPTSGLDSEAAKHVINLLSRLARQEKRTIVATIHQPSSECFALFDKIMLLSRGYTVFHGTPSQALVHFDQILHQPCPEHYNPADHYLSIANVDFDSGDAIAALAKVKGFAEQFQSSSAGQALNQELQIVKNHPGTPTTAPGYAAGILTQTYVLTERSFKNAGKNLLLYWIRAAMFLCMAILMGTTFWDVGLLQTEVQDRFSAHFFAVAFLCFMSVASIPGILEEKSVVDREILNGAYNVTSFVITNTLTSLPFILLIAIIFSVIAYPMIQFQGGVVHVVNYVLFLFLALYTMESIVVCLACLMPIFVVALALAAFLNGFFMCVQGYFVRVQSLPKFWRYWAHYWSYQKYAFEALVKSDFDGLVFSCGPGCFCQYPSTLNAQCQFTGHDVLVNFEYDTVNLTNWALVLVGQIVVYRVLMVLILKWKTKRAIQL